MTGLRNYGPRPARPANWTHASPPWGGGSGPTAARTSSNVVSANRRPTRSALALHHRPVSRLTRTVRPWRRRSARCFRLARDFRVAGFTARNFRQHRPVLRRRSGSRTTRRQRSTRLGSENAAASSIGPRAGRQVPSNTASSSPAWTRTGCTRSGASPLVPRHRLSEKLAPPAQPVRLQRDDARPRPARRRRAARLR